MPNKIIWTGHRPPAEQIRNQVRSGTGATYAREMFAFHRLGSSAHRLASAITIIPGQKLALGLMSLLATIERSGADLPYPEQIAEQLGENDHPAIVMASLRQLARNGAFALWCARDETIHAGEFKIRLPGGETILRTARAPAYGKV